MNNSIKAASEETTDEKIGLDKKLLERLLPRLFDERKDLNKEGKALIKKYPDLIRNKRRRLGRRIRSRITHFQQGGLEDVMPDQSLGSVSGEDDSDNLDPIEYLDRILDQDSVDFEGHTYNKSTCYQVDENRVFGIKEFLRHGTSDSCVSAFCIEIIPFEKTLLETVNSTGMKKFIQRGGSEREIHLSDLQKKMGEIPEFLYHERQSGSSHIFFGLEDASKARQRNGFRNLKQSPLRGIDLFAGAGLMSNGFQAATFNVVISVEKDEDATSSYARAHEAHMSTVSAMTSNGCKNILANKGKIAFNDTVEAFLGRCAIDPSFTEALGPIDFVIACSPCQGFSKQNIYKAGDAERNNFESLRILKVAELLRPRVIVFENVLGMWESKHIKGYLQKMVNGLTFEFGYNVKVGKIIAADFGDPQLRPRLFLIASLSDIGIPVFPKPTHSQPGLCSIVPSGLVPYTTARDALILEENKYPVKENPVNDDGRPRDPNRPTTSVLASKSAAHYNVNLNRFYSLQENAILMGQSPDFVSKLVGDNKSKQRQIGNGVSMGTAKAIAKSCLEVLKWNWEGVENRNKSLRIKKSDECIPSLVEMPSTDIQVKGEADVTEISHEISYLAKSENEETLVEMPSTDIQVKGEADVTEISPEISYLAKSENEETSTK